jgi:HPt (histidine-containing phosphotransfer) domain-containing protein
MGPLIHGRRPDTHPIIFVENPSSLPPALDPEALAALRELNPGDDSFFQDLVQIFLDDSPQRIAEMEQALAKGVARQLMHAAHSLKGSSSNFGAGRLRALSEQLELLGRQGSLGDAPGQLHALKEEFVRVKTALEALLPGK